MGRRKKQHPDWKPTVPDPAVFQLPKPSNKPVTIRALSASDDHSPGRHDNRNNNQTRSRPANEQTPEQKTAVSPQNLPDNVDVATISLGNNGSSAPSSMTRRDVAQTRNPVTLERTLGESNDGNGLPAWRPNIFVQAFVPQSLL